MRAIHLCVAVLILTWLSGASWTAAAEVARRPNVLLLVGDDHQYETIGAYGSKLARTPNLDRLAAGGIRFNRAYCNAPICTPSRQSFLTGRYPHAVGVTLLTQALDDAPYTLAERLRDAGYRTGAFGKMHFNSKKLHGFEVHADEAAWRAMDAKRVKKPLPEEVEVLPPWRPFKDPASIWLNSFYRPFGRHDDEMPGTWFAEQAIDFIREHREEPFFVQIGFQEPHSPYTFPVEMRGMYDPASLPLPPVGPDDPRQVPKIFTDLTPEQKRGIIASYHTSVAFLDRNVGRVLAALDELKLSDNTLVIYLGDNGYHLGHHGRFEKHSMFERAVRVPLIMRLPGQIRPGQTTDALVEFVDLAPTVLSYVGVEQGKPEQPLHELQGTSLRPLIEGRTTRVHEAVFSEYQHTEEAMVCTPEWKLIYRTRKGLVDWYEPVEKPRPGEIRLYNLKADPEEFHNVAGEPDNAARVDQMLNLLADWYRRTPPRNAGPVPENLSREEFLDWAIAAREQP